MATPSRTHDAYTVGWVCALPKEQTVAIAIFYERYPNLSKPPNDPNSYTLGLICGHNIVIACLPEGKVGTISAATVAIHMVGAFPAVRFGLIVGIGGGVPPKVQLGDVVVSVPVDQYPGVVQWDMGKAEQGGTFRRTGALNNPPSLLLSALTTLKFDIHDWLRSICDRIQNILFEASYDPVEKQDQDASQEEDESEDDASEDCQHCDKTQILKWKPRDIRVHYGLTASGRQEVKDARKSFWTMSSQGGDLVLGDFLGGGLEGIGGGAQAAAQAGCDGFRLGGISVLVLDRVIELGGCR